MVSRIHKGNRVISLLFISITCPKVARASMIHKVITLLSLFQKLNIQFLTLVEPTFLLAQPTGPAKPREDLEAVHLDLLWVDKANLGEELADVLPLITLQLQNLSVFRVLYNSSIACKLLFTCSNYLFEIILG